MFIAYIYIMKMILLKIFFKLTLYRNLRPDPPFQKSIDTVIMT
jgi:hypothetical protein